MNPDAPQQATAMAGATIPSSSTLPTAPASASNLGATPVTTKKRDFDAMQTNSGEASHEQERIYEVQRRSSCSPFPLLCQFLH